MKSCLLFLLCSFNLIVFGQAGKQQTDHPDFTTEDIIFTSTKVNLAGTVYRPKHSFASVVLVHGSGKEARMEEMAVLLAKNGITVLTYDKRGVGKSGGVYVGPEVGTNNIDPSNLDLLASDADAASNALLKLLPRKHGPLGLMGFSQAGWIIPLAAEKNKMVSYMVLFSGPVVTTLEQLRFQFYTEGKSRFWDTHTETEAREHVRSDPDKYQFAPTDPNSTLAGLSIPGLWLFGGKDVQIPVGLSIEHLNELKAQGKSYDYQLFPELGHNTGFSKSAEPVSAAIRWIKNINNLKKRK